MVASTISSICSLQIKMTFMRPTFFQVSKLLHAVLLFPAFVAPSFALEPDELFAQVSKSVMLVTTYGPNNALLGTGSAVTIAPGKLLTNCHVLAKANRFEIRIENVSYAAKLEHIDVKRDLCQISAKNFHAPPVKIADSDQLRVGQKVYAIGNPRGLELTLSDGLISALRRDDNEALQLIQTSAPISKGSSGGGLFDSSGRLVGITTLMLVDGQNLNFAIPINWLKDLPERSQAALAQAAANEKAAATAEPIKQANVNSERQLTASELSEHFSVPRKVEASTDLYPSIELVTTPDGIVQVTYTGTDYQPTTPLARYGYGIFKIKTDEDQICIAISSGKFTSLRGCYRLFQAGPNDYILRAVADKSFIKYKI